jgi:thiamine biosynthesis protein ThiS
MHIKLTGRDQESPAGTSVLGLLESLGLDARKIAVERNLEIVPRSAHGTTVLGEGDRLEIVNFVGGG